MRKPSCGIDEGGLLCVVMTSAVLMALASKKRTMTLQNLWARQADCQKTFLRESVCSLAAVFALCWPHSGGLIKVNFRNGFVLICSICRGETSKANKSVKVQHVCYVHYVQYCYLHLTMCREWSDLQCTVSFAFLIIWTIWVWYSWILGDTVFTKCLELIEW